MANRRNDPKHRQPGGKNFRSRSGSGSRRPTQLGTVLSELIAIRGLGRVQGLAELASAWKSVVGEPYASITKVQHLRNGVLQVAVGNAALLNELSAFRHAELLRRLQTDFPDKKIRDLKFKLKGDLQPNT